MAIKYIFFSITSLALFSSFCSQENEGKKVSSTKCYMVAWDTKYNFPITTENIKKRCAYIFENKRPELDLMFFDYKDCVKKLVSQDTLANETSNIVSSCAELNFGNKKLILFFKNSGDYFFGDKWHKVNSGLYYYLFNNLSNTIIPELTLNRAKNIVKDRFWHPNI